eukprot:2897095-Rhodomonas_salina.1
MLRMGCVSKPSLPCDPSDSFSTVAEYRWQASDFAHSVHMITKGLQFGADHHHGVGAAMGNLLAMAAT